MIGLTHFVAALVALVSGALVTVRPKGTRWHVWSGRSYLGSMTLMLVTSMMIYDLFDGFGPFHYLAIFTALTIVAGMILIYRGRSGRHWIISHANWMSWSYIGL